MSHGKLARGLILGLAALAVSAAFAVLDWYPTVKDLGRLRRERGDVERRIKEYGAMAAGFTFPDEAEKTTLAAADADLLRALPMVKNDDGWAALAMVDVESFARSDRIANARPILAAPGILSGNQGAPKAGNDPLDPWSGARPAEISAAFAMAGDPDRFPWRGAFSGLKLHPGRPAIRVAGLIAAAPIHDLLDLVNHVSWGETRLEIVRLRLEPGIPYARAWLVCRGLFLVSGPSGWLVKLEAGKDDAPLLIDADSPLLWRRADPLFAPAIEKRELPPASGAERE